MKYETIKCDRCKSNKIAGIFAKCCDQFTLSYKDKSKNCYVPRNIGLGDMEDYIEISYCIECGKIQGKFPLDEKAFRSAT